MCISLGITKLVLCVELGTLPCSIAQDKLVTNLNLSQGCHTSGKSQGKVVFFKVREMSGNFEICQGKNEF